MLTVLLMSTRIRVDRDKVKRRAIQVIKSRLEDVEVGDIVNRNPDAELGWFLVDAISILFNGHIQLADDTEQLTVSGGHKDMVGVQIVEEVVLDERGVIMAPTPATTVVAAPMPAAAPSPVEEPIQSEHVETALPTTAPPSDSPAVPAALGGPAEVVDLEAEAAAAAAIATEMDAPAPGNGRTAPGVDLALVASLLENLDVSEAPTISSEVSNEPMMADSAPAIPANAVAVDGGALPAKPSYKNPIVVPESSMLPRRSRSS